MIPRTPARTRRAPGPWTGLLAAALGLSALAGCDPRQAMYFLQPFEPKIGAPCPSLKGKRVVILTTTVPGLSGDTSELDREVGRELASILEENVKKIDVVETERVADWAQAKVTWTDPVEAAKAFEADVVIMVEIREFQIQDPSSPGLFEGRANTHIKVVELAHPKDDRGREMTDRPKESKTLWEGDRSTAHPKSGPISLGGGANETTFRNTFLKIAVREISWAFVDHAPGDNIYDTRFDE
jgi:hypothetical protein